MNKPIDATLLAIRAGTPEAGTELPPNSRPSHDAGQKPASTGYIEREPAAPVKSVAGQAGGQKNR
jgi:hypothetical protein